ncbi:hypothetical protein FHR38_005844 [Micromonospora polyrhachis]|uniref:Uncharacterized protein n=1 Tax=Micromonospora polyrhachis TaxID=1282883 RepID=A0A7W7SWZ5_9ACTN|nr:hypothetical protein [Micromonospora polyrhachis]
MTLSNWEGDGMLRYLTAVKRRATRATRGTWYYYPIY